MTNTRRKTAVIIVDVQNALCVGDGATFNAQEVISKVNEVILKARAAEAPIIFVQHETKSGPFVYKSFGWFLPEELNNSDSDIYIRKTASDSFHGTDLQAKLDVLGVNHLIVCGMQSEFCVDSTVRRALALGYEITIVADGHTTVDNEVLTAASISKHHNHTWENITSYGPRAKAVSADLIVL